MPPKMLYHFVLPLYYHSPLFTYTENILQIEQNYILRKDFAATTVVLTLMYKNRCTHSLVPNKVEHTHSILYYPVAPT